MQKYSNMRHRELPLSKDSSNLFLKVMISIAVFLFAVTLSGVLSINSMLVNWNASILGSLTVAYGVGLTWSPRAYRFGRVPPYRIWATSTGASPRSRCSLQQ